MKATMKIIALSKAIYTGLPLEQGIEYFSGFEKEFEFIQNYYRKHKKVPTLPEFVDKFPEGLIPEQDTGISKEVLLKGLEEERVAEEVIPLMVKFQEELKKDSIKATEQLIDELKRVRIKQGTIGQDIIKESNERLRAVENIKPGYSTGLIELDEVLGGVSQEEEFVVFFARTGHGKSWVLTKVALEIWKKGKNIAYFSPEMSPLKIGFRLDTLNKGFSNFKISRGGIESGYKEYINSLEGGNHSKFIVFRPADLDNRPTISKLERLCKNENIDLLCIDGLSYLVDEREQRGDSTIIKLGNISVDLMKLSVDLKIPVCAVIQANRGGVRNEGTPEIESIRGSDAVSHNATKIIAIRKGEANTLELGVKKNRDGISDGTLVYKWNVDKGSFLYVPTVDAPSIVGKKEKPDYKDKKLPF